MHSATTASIARSQFASCSSTVVGTAAPRITRGLCDVYQDADGAAYAIVRDHLRALALPC
ncbi:hypothetical protein [Bifidobacterium choerinum]|uniref:hypothetical protein n=1 Tax=Bifidobacterium choerinum TaxID=35760 RepID=UPI000558A981|nr:hypothetical protein [Bifidobacterium choerinum]